MAPVRIRKNYEYPQHKGIDFSKSPSLTKQSEAAGCDINNILSKFEKTGILPELIRADGRYGDFSEVPEYQAAHEIISRAQEQFAALSAPVRERFGNDPAQMLQFCTNPANSKAMVEMGLALERAPSQPAPGTPITGVDSSGVQGVTGAVGAKTQ